MGVESAFRVQGEGIDGEIASAQILADGCAAQGHELAALPQADLSGAHGAGVGMGSQEVLPGSGKGIIPFTGQAAQQQVAHRAPYKIGFHGRTMTENRAECILPARGRAGGAARAASPRADSAGCPFVWRLGEVSSTLDAAQALMAAGHLGPWESLQAVRQRNGRGQLRRQWLSPAGNIYATLRLPASEPFRGTEATPALSLMLAAAFAQWGLAVRVKWPNDLVVEKDGEARKIAGILMEERGGILSAGIGINVVWRPEPAALRAGAAMPAACLTEIWPGGAGRCPGAERLWPLLVKSLYSAYSSRRSPMIRCHEAVSRHLLWQGRQVVIEDGEERVSGILAGLHPDGGARLLCGDGERIFYSGSLRLPDDNHKGVLHGQQELC